MLWTGLNSPDDDNRDAVGGTTHPPERGNTTGINAAGTVDAGFTAAPADASAVAKAKAAADALAAKQRDVEEFLARRKQ